MFRRHPKYCALFLSLLACQTARSQTAADNQQLIAQHSRAAQQYIQQKRPELAIPELQKLVALDPGSVDAHGNLGVLLYFRGDFKAAAPELRSAVRLKPDLWKLEGLLGLAEAQVHEGPSSRTDLAAAFPNLQDQKFKKEIGLALIDNYTATGELDKSVSIVSTLLEADPTNPSLLFTSYQIYAQLADRATLSLALVAPGSAQMHQLMARELARHGDDAAAIANYRESLKLDPHLPGAHFELASVLYNAEDARSKTEAESEFQAALAANPQDEKAALMLGVIAAKRSDWHAALDYDSRALNQQPDDPDACVELARVLLVTHAKDKAQLLIEHAIEVDPTDYVAHYRLSSLYRQQGRQAESEKELASYRKYKYMKDKLQTVMHDMRVKAGPGVQADSLDPQ